MGSMSSPRKMIATIALPSLVASLFIGPGPIISIASSLISFVSSILLFLLFFIWGGVSYLGLRLFLSDQASLRPELPEELLQSYRLLEQEEKRHTEVVKGEEEERRKRGPVNHLVLEMTDLTLKHWVFPHLTGLEEGNAGISRICANDVETVIENLRTRLATINHVNFLTRTVLDVITSELEGNRMEKEEGVRREVEPHLVSSDKEEEYLRVVAGVLTVHLLPANYSSTPVMLQLCQDILASYFLLPAINKMSDPDFLNQKVIKYFWKREGTDGVEDEIDPETKIEQEFQPAKVLGNTALEEERQELLEHLERTDAWAAGLGEWRARVQEVDGVGGGVGGGGGVVSLVVYLPGGAASWLVERSLAEFHSLRHHLQGHFPWVRKLDLPAMTKNIFNTKRTDKADKDKAWLQLQRFLDAVLEDELVTGSELVYAFLSPSPDHLKLAPEQGKKTKFFQLSRMFKPIGPGGGGGEAGGQEKKGKKAKEEKEKKTKEEEESATSLPKSPFSSMSDMEVQVGTLYLARSASQQSESTHCQAPDGLAEPLYALISEVFDLRGVFRLLRYYDDADGDDVKLSQCL